MHPYMKRLIATVGALVLVFGLSVAALSVTTQQIGLAGKQVYTYDQATGFARMEVIISNMVATLITATELAPELVEGAAAGLSVDLANNLRVVLGVPLYGEDTTNNLFRVSGGQTRVTQLVGTGGIPSTASDEVWPTAGPTLLPVGMKTFQGVVTCTGTCTQVQKIYGSYINNEVTTTSVLVCTLTLAGAGGNAPAVDWCKDDRNFSYWFVVTSGSGGTTPLAGLFVYH